MASRAASSRVCRYPLEAGFPARCLRLFREEIEKVGLPRLERRLCRLRLGGASLGRSRFRGGGRCLALRHQPFLPLIAPVTPPRPGAPAAGGPPRLPAPRRTEIT